MMIQSNSYQLDTSAKPDNQASLESKLSFPWLDVSLQQLGCRAAVHGKSAEILTLFHDQLRGLKLPYWIYSIFSPS